MPGEYADHLKSEATKCWNAKAIPLTWDGWYRRQEIQYMKTKIVFSNGLVLFHQNVSATDFGNHKRFWKNSKKMYEALREATEVESKRRQNQKIAENALIATNDSLENGNEKN